MATTTALVSGLVGLELMKVAAEKSKLRKKHQDEQTAFSTFTSSRVSADTAAEGVLREKVGGLRPHKVLFSLGGRLRNLFSKKLNDATKTSSSTSHDPTKDSTYNNKLERQRILGRFRNSFINLDGPVMAHAEPSAAEEVPTPIKEQGAQQGGGGGEVVMSFFSMWDSIQVSSGVALGGRKDRLDSHLCHIVPYCCITSCHVVSCHVVRCM